MSRNSYPLLVASVWVLAACSSSPTRPSPTEGNAQLGITEFRTAETPTTLSITGVDGAGNTIGELQLRIGSVSIPFDERVAFGRELKLEVNGVSMEHESEGMRPLALPYPEDRTVTGFLADPYVAAVLEDWGITITTKTQTTPTTSAPAPDRGYTDCTYASDCTQVSCCQNGYVSGSPLDQYLCCATGVYGVRSCSDPYAYTPCGYAGPKGCAVCWQGRWSGQCLAYETAPSQCAFSITGGGGGSCLPLNSPCAFDAECCNGHCGIQGSCGYDQ